MDKLKNLIVDDDIDEQDKLKTRMLIQGKKIKRKPSFALDPNAAQDVQNALNSSGLSSLGDLSLNSTTCDTKPCVITSPRTPILPQNSVDLSEAGSTKSKFSPTNGESLLDLSDDESDIDDSDSQFLEDPVLKKYKNSFKHIGNDPENVPIFMLTARDLPSEKLINYEDISNRLADYAQEQLALIEAPNYIIYFVAGMAKGEHLPSVKTSERLRLRWSSKKTLKKLFFIHLGVKNNIYITRLMASLSEDTKSKLIKCTKTKSLEKYGHNSKLPLPIDLANFDKNV